MQGKASYQLRSRREQLAHPPLRDAEQAERDLRVWADRYEADAHEVLHAVFPAWVTPPSKQETS
jgi:hypothetical protein